METPALTLYGEVEDKKLAARFRATLKREGRSMKTVLTIAVRDYIAKSEAAAQPAPSAAQPQEA